MRGVGGGVLATEPHPYSPAQTPSLLHSSPRIGSKVTAKRSLRCSPPGSLQLSPRDFINPGFSWGIQGRGNLAVGIWPWECSHQIAGYLGILGHRVAVSGAEELCAPLAVAHSAPRSGNLRFHGSGLPMSPLCPRSPAGPPGPTVPWTPRHLAMLPASAGWRAQ